jgi:hypothetical protein
VCEIPLHQQQEPKFLVPWFVLKTVDSSGKEKSRLIADCRVLNSYLQTSHFKLDHWQQIFPVLRKGMWGAKIDLKHAYFHLALSEKIRPYVRMQVGKRQFQFQAACFGLAPLPQLWMSLMKVFSKKWRGEGIIVFIYLDEILVVSSSKSLLQKQLDGMLLDLSAGGMQINREKYLLVPSQEVDHLGFHVHLREGLLQVPPQKLKQVRKELGKLVTHSSLSPRKMAAILGTVRSFLVALPFLRAFTDEMKCFIDLQGQGGWDRMHPLPVSLVNQVKEVKDLLQTWQGRQFQARCPIRKLHSDASNVGWGGLDIQSGTGLQEFWRQENGLHINVKELHAAISTVRSLAKKGEQVHLAVDNVVAYSYLKKSGGKLPQFNHMLRPFLKWCMEQKVRLLLSLVKSEDMLQIPCPECLQTQGITA